MRLGEGNSAKRLASTIVTPSRVDHDMDENVTKRTKGLTRSLSFTTLSDQEPVIVVGDNQIIGALNDMEIEDQQDDGMMECEMLHEDLLGLDLKEMEDTAAQHDSIIVTAGPDVKALKNSRKGTKATVPRKLSSSSHGAHTARESSKSRHHYQSLKKQRDQEDIPMIRSLAISPTHRRDTICWSYTKNGQYTVKSGYWVAVKRNMIRRNMRCDNYCPRCEELEETVTHAIFECRPALQAWALSSTPSSSQTFPISSIYANMDYLFWRKNSIDKDPLEIVRHVESECEAWYNAKDTIHVPAHAQIVEETKALSLGNICMVDGSWTSTNQFSGIGWVWKDSMRKIQLMGTWNLRRRETALHSE
uniref:Uncharacterized protein n=1 Tax=Brassica oleracea var. oleracea TaxID=109376 RepID=A0A0D2ZQM2_BRAOL